MSVLFARRGMFSSSDSGSGTSMVTITGAGNSTRCYVNIGGVKYTSAAAIEVENGTVAIMHKEHMNTEAIGSMAGELYLDGALIDDGNKSFNYPVTKNITVRMVYETGDGNYCRSYIYITTE